VISSNLTFTRPFALWKFIFRQFCYMLCIQLLFMARITKVSIPPTKPNCDRTTKLAFETYVLLSMFWAVCYLCTRRDTLWAYQIFRFKLNAFPILIHRLCTVFATSKVWLFAFPALKVSVERHSVLFLVFVVRRFWIRQPFIFVFILDFKPF
jgi:hypothetical protein